MLCSGKFRRKSADGDAYFDAGYVRMLRIVAAGGRAIVIGSLHGGACGFRDPFAFIMIIQPCAAVLGAGCLCCDGSG